MKVLRTPDECFAGLEGYGFEPHYTEVTGGDGTPIRIHHVDEGPRDAVPILLMHGNPTWAYLYRKFVPPLAAAGHRFTQLWMAVPKPAFYLFCQSFYRSHGILRRKVEFGVKVYLKTDRWQDYHG